MTFKNSPKVSFVVPCYNYGRFLPDCLRSIFEQKNENDFEVIVIDDGSTDNTREVLDSFSDSRLRVIHHKSNLGHAATINEALREARGNFIARIDPDDRYRPYFLTASLEKFVAFPDVGLVWGDAALINEDGEITSGCSDSIHGERDFKGNEFVRLLERNFISSPTVIARREAWLNALPVPEDLAFHDWYFTLMMARENNFYYINRVLAEYRVHPMCHHAMVVKNKTEETSIFRLLKHIFRKRETDPTLELQKNKAKHRIYSTQYLTLADKYFGFQMYDDARRSYLAALRHRPLSFLGKGVVRRLIGTFMGPALYEKAKAVLLSHRRG